MNVIFYTTFIILPVVVNIKIKQLYIIITTIVHKTIINSYYKTKALKIWLNKTNFKLFNIISQSVKKNFNILLSNKYNTKINFSRDHNKLSNYLLVKYVY